MQTYCLLKLGTRFSLSALVRRALDVYCDHLVALVEQEPSGTLAVGDLTERSLLFSKRKAHPARSHAKQQTLEQLVAALHKSLHDHPSLAEAWAATRERVSSVYEEDQ